ncbi:MAG: O-antigen ligase family protein [Vicinamibacterales bacterium]
MDRPTVLVAAMLLVAGVTWLRPRWAVALLLAALPFFTHHPSSFPTVMLIVLVAVLEVVYTARARPSATRAWRAISSQPLLLLSALFTGAALLSLSALPLASIWHEHAAALDGQPWSAVPARLLQWVLLTEVRREFPITSAMLVLQAFVLSLVTWREARASSAAALLFARALVLGAVVLVGMGLLEAFGAVSLDTLRGAASVYFREGTLQSASGNPGWFSQYLVYTVPYALVILVGETRPGLRLALLGGVTGLMAFALLVSWQRGGWLFGGMVVLYVVVAAALLRRSGGVTGARVTQRALALSIVVLALVAGAFALWMSKAHPGGAALDVNAYLVRLKSIADADRLSYVQAGRMIASLHPVLGGGHESFAYRYRMYFEAPGGPFHASATRVPEAASAHNVFLQALTGTGIVGALLLTGILVAAAWTGLRALRAADMAADRLVVVLAACGSLLGFAGYGLVQEVFYVHALRVLFFASVGLVAGAAGDRIRWSPRVGRGLWTALGVAFVVHLGYEYVWPGPTRLLAPGEVTGVHAEQRPPGDDRPLWSSDWATWPVPQGATSYVMRVRSLAPFPQELSVAPCGGATRRVVLADHDWHPIGGRIEGCGPEGRVQLRVKPTWRAPGDDRLLGVLTAGVRFE